MRRVTMTAAIAFVALLALGACGRKGDLEPPPNVSPDMAATPPACASPAEGQPVDADRPGTVPSGNPTQLPDSIPGC